VVNYGDKEAEGRIKSRRTAIYDPKDNSAGRMCKIKEK
jgi:hypothetical protein